MSRWSRSRADRERGGGGSETGKQGHVGQTHGKQGDRHRDVQTLQIGAEQRGGKRHSQSVRSGQREKVDQRLSGLPKESALLPGYLLLN